MDSRLRSCKRAIRVFLRTAYTDERLAWLVAHARGGKLVYNSCCCLVGITTADHALEGRVPAARLLSSHYAFARRFLGADEAERAYYRLGWISRTGRGSAEEVRRQRLIPMALAELRRRERMRAHREMEAVTALVERKRQVDVWA